MVSLVCVTLPRDLISPSLLIYCLWFPSVIYPQQTVGGLSLFNLIHLLTTQNPNVPYISPDSLKYLILEVVSLKWYFIKFALKIHILNKQ